jgi:hypothetical protein
MKLHKKNKLIDLLNQQNKSKTILILFDISFSAVLIVGLFRRYQFIKKKK